MELIESSVSAPGVDDLSLQKQQVEEEKSKTVPKSANKRVVVWPEFKVPLPDPVLGKSQRCGTFCFYYSLKALQGRFSAGKVLSPPNKPWWSSSRPLLLSMKLRSSHCAHWSGTCSRLVTQSK